MAIYTRGKWLWTSFYFEKEHIQEPTGVQVGTTPKAQGQNYKRAVAYEERRKAELHDPSIVKVKRQPAPTLREFEKRFMDSVKTRSADKPATIGFYESKFTRLLEFTPLADTRLDRIDEALIDSYVQHRRQTVSPASTNRELATLRKALRLAQEWRIIDRVPRIRLLPGEKIRDFVLSHAQEELYLANAPQPLADFAVLALDTGLRLREVLALEWPDVHLTPVNGAKFGYLHVRKGKSRNAQRNLSLTPRVRTMLERRAMEARSVWVFASLENALNPLSVFTVEDQHKRARKDADLSSEFVVHSLRHTYGTRLGEAGADAFTIMRLMGHSTVVVSQRYVHPTPEAMERAIERLDAMNAIATKRLKEARQSRLPATNPATFDEGEKNLALQVS